MPQFLLNRWHGMHVTLTYVFMIVLTIVLFFYNEYIGIGALLLTGVVAYFRWKADIAFRKDLNVYLSTISHRVRKAGNEVMNEMPLGILLYNEDMMIQWHNPFIAMMVGRESVIGDQLTDVFPELILRKDRELKKEIAMGESIYHVLHRPEERLVYFNDTTAFSKLQKRYEEEKIALGIVVMDNLDEVTQGMDDQSRSIMLAKVTTEISDWAQKNNFYLRRTASDRYLAIMDQATLSHLESTKFDILDEVRDITIEHKLPLTLSIGIAAGEDHLIELGALAQSSLDIALGRGGDQAAVKIGQRLSFYGGRSNAIEKRTRVRARVISHALRDLIKESDKIIIMGHRIPDMDAIGAAIGVLKAAQVSGKEGYIVLERINPSIERLMEEIQTDDHLNRWFITPDQALQITGPHSLIVVVDTHKSSMVIEPRLLQQSQRIIVVDHHRRGEDFINESILVYMEPYASSTCELVTELLQYFSDHLKMSVLEATALLAGIVVDTKSFAISTGARTFEAASFLRRNGADSMLIKRLMKEDLESYILKSEIVKNAKVLYNHIAVSATEPDRNYSQLIIAQAADILMNITDIMASFVISERKDGKVGISARSLGQINVQLVMERFGGGGHLTNAAAQWEGSIEEAEYKLEEILGELVAGEELFV